MLALATPLLSIADRSESVRNFTLKQTTVNRDEKKPATSKSRYITLFLCGDVMTGRGIDQVLPHPGDPRIYEPYMRDANGYVKLAARESGFIPRPVEFSYIWGDALNELERVAPDVRMINLETAITRSNDFWPRKGINYRMHPDNIPCLTTAGIDCCALANNHVLDWGYSGLEETLQILTHAGIKYAGAGLNRKEAEAPVIVEIAGKGRVIVLSLGSVTSGIPRQWAATERRAGVNLLHAFSVNRVEQIAAALQDMRQPGDILLASIHWGGNWGYEVPAAQTAFAHQLIDIAGIDIVHGHSSHHPKGIEIYKQRPIIYGCGDFLNDYEGIGGYEAYRGDLALMYFVTLDATTGSVINFEMTPTTIRRFRVNFASREEAQWIGATLTREGERFGTRTELNKHNRLLLRWQ